MTETEARCRTCRHLDPAYLKVYTGYHAFCKDPAKVILDPAGAIVINHPWIGLDYTCSNWTEKDDDQQVG